MYLQVLAILALLAFAKLRKATTSFVMSVRLSVRPFVLMEQLGSYWTDFHDIEQLSIFRKSVEEFKVSLKFAKNDRYFT